MLAHISKPVAVGISSGKGVNGILIQRGPPSFLHPVPLVVPPVAAPPVMPPVAA